MQTAPFPILAPVNRNASGFAISDDGAESLIDGYTDEKGEQVRRPGLSLAVSLGTTQCWGGYYWSAGNVAFAVIGSSICTLTYAGGVVSSSAQAIVGLNPSCKPSWTTDGTYIYMCCGGAIYRGTATAGSFAVLADADAPVHCTHIAFLDGYIIANDTTTGRFHFSSPANGSTWAALDYANPESNPDYLIAMKEMNQELYFFGRESLETWRNDGISPFSKVDGACLDLGCLASQSVILDSDGLYFISINKKLSIFNGRSVQELDTPYDKFLRNLDSVSEADGYSLGINGKKFLLWSFPSANKTIVLNSTDKNFSEWGKWESSKADYDRFLGNDAVWCHGWDKLLILGRDGSVYFMDPSYLSDNGDVIRMAKRTGHIDHGTSQEKVCEQVRIRAKRGGSFSGTPKVMIRFRNNGKSQWSNERQRSLGATGDTNMYIVLNRQGVYRSRQWEIAVTDAVSVSFGKSEEDFSVLR